MLHTIILRNLYQASYVAQLPQYQYMSHHIRIQNYIHAEGVCHRDLKPENMLLDAAGTLKISDFGLSAVYKIKETGKTRQLTERCGSLPYVAPEVRHKRWSKDTTSYSS